MEKKEVLSVLEKARQIGTRLLKLLDENRDLVEYVPEIDYESVRMGADGKVYAWGLVHNCWGWYVEGAGSTDITVLLDLLEEEKNDEKI